MKGKWQERKRRGVQGARRAAAEAARGRAADAGRGRARRGRGCRGSSARRGRRSSRCRSPTPRAQIDATGDGVVVFRDAETAAISVLYRRTNGELTLVETET